jgi:hypothetical protein
LLRDIFGSPYRPATGCLDQSFFDQMPPHGTIHVLDLRDVMRWNDGTVPRLAEGIYQNRAFDHMPILHDVLLDAGCDDEALLAHCQGLMTCLTCGGKGKRDCQVDAGYGNPLMTRDGWQWCYYCNEGGRGKTPGLRPLRGPHVRGCWVIDLLTGRN